MLFANTFDYRAFMYSRPEASDMLPVNVTSLKNASPLAVVTPFRRAAGKCARRPAQGCNSCCPSCGCQGAARRKGCVVRNGMLFGDHASVPCALYAYAVVAVTPVESGWLTPVRRESAS